MEGIKLSTGILRSAALEETADGKDYKAVFKKKPFPKTDNIPDKDYLESQSLMGEMIEVTDDPSSKFFYQKVARICPSDMIYRTLSEVKEEASLGEIQKSKGALFTHKIKEKCREADIDLELKK